MYLTITFITASMSEGWNTKTVISSAYTKTFTTWRPTKGTLRKARFAFSFLSLRSKGSKATDRSISKDSERFLFIVTTVCESLCRSPIRIRRFPKLLPRTDDQLSRNPWTNPNWSVQHLCYLLFPLWSRVPSVYCSGLIFPSQRSSPQVRSNPRQYSANDSPRSGPKSLILCITELWAKSVRQWLGRLGFNPRSNHNKDWTNSTWWHLA